jgi:MYXO-CTERM domain-containing protein
MPAMSDHRRDAEEQPHDVLAAEEFSIGTRDERLPPDPTGNHEPHDVLAAEEFAMPSPADHADAGPGGPGRRAWVPLAALALGAVVLLRRRRSWR